MRPSILFLFLVVLLISACSVPELTDEASPRQRISINEGWRFMKYAAGDTTDNLIYDVRPEVTDSRDDKPADARPTEAVEVEAQQQVLKPWIMPSGNAFVKNAADRYVRPDGNPGAEFAFVQDDFNDDTWEVVDLPHDWAIKEPFYAGNNVPVGGGMGRLPSPGIAWYRKTIQIPMSDEGKSIYLDIDGAMSYAMVWVNGKLAGGWPYGYSSFRIDLTPYILPGEENQLAIRLDNPPNSSRWYPGGGIYRNVWLIKTDPVHVGHWGTFIRTPEASHVKALVEVDMTIENSSKAPATILSSTKIYVLENNKRKDEVASFEPVEVYIGGGEEASLTRSTELKNPRLWGPPPGQTPNLYVAVTTLSREGAIIDTYETRFGIRTIKYDPSEGLMVNGEKVFIQGVNQHHDLGALGAAWNYRAAERQLELLREMGVNAIRMAHNPPAPELLELTDRLGFLVVDELYDCWERKKTPLDFHLIFPDWHEQDLRSLVRRDRNSPSVIMWSTGNEVGEQYTGEDGAKIAENLSRIVREEDPTRPATASMNYAKPGMPLPAVQEVISLNYQGEGIRNAPAYAHLKGINTSPLYPKFHDAFPGKVIVSSENAAALSTRNTYIFPVTDGISAPISPGLGGDPERHYVSAYELYTADFGSSADKVFASIDQHPYVSGGFVWSGWDYLGEPTPYYSSRSSYFGIIDLAGFKKDRFYLYQSRWRPDHPMTHILPHWNWPEREGEVTPVHVFTSGDEAELFLNGTSLGKKKKNAYEYRLRWDDVIYAPGELIAVAYKNGKQWSTDTVVTTKAAVALEISSDRSSITSDGRDLCFVTVRIVDEDGRTVPMADHEIEFSLEGPGILEATDNGDPTDLVSFSSHVRKAFGGLVLGIIRSEKKKTGKIVLTVSSPELESAKTFITSL